MVPDQTDQLQDIGWEVPVQAVAEYLDSHPLLVSCQLCLMRRVVKVDAKLEIFRGVGNEKTPMLAARPFSCT